MALHMYNFTLQNPSAIMHAVCGNFSDPGEYEILVSRGHLLELLHPDTNGKLNSIASTNILGLIRSIATFRLPGARKDYIVICSDSGKITILEFKAERLNFVKIHEETFGRSGVRRVVPGQFLALDPSGRAAMTGALEKQKFVYILNRDNEAQLTISSPLEAHKSNTFLFDLVGIDVNYMNPLFAAIEMDYYKCDQDASGESVSQAEKMLTWYELDLGLNHVVRKSAQVIDRTSHRLISVPGDNGNPGGVIVCSKNHLVYHRSPGTPTGGGQFLPYYSTNDPNPSTRSSSLVEVVIPRRRNRIAMDENGKDDLGTLIVAHTIIKSNTAFFFLIQSEFGDLFKLTFVTQPLSDSTGNSSMIPPGTNTPFAIVNQMIIQYYDTVPVARSIAILPPGFLFVASESGNQYLYFLKDLEQEVNGTIGNEMDQEGNDQDLDLSQLENQSHSSNFSNHIIHPKIKVFDPWPLRHLQVSDEIPCLAPIIDLKIENIDKDDTPQLLALCGSGPRSTLRILRYGIPVLEAASVQLPTPATAIWVLKTQANEPYDQYIVVSFASSTLILAIGDTVEEIHSGDPLHGCLITNMTTLAIGRLSDETLVQVTPAGYRHIRQHTFKTWEAPSGQKVTHAAFNQQQLVVSLEDSGDLHAFELDSSGNLTRVAAASVGKEIVALAIQPVPANRQRARYLAVADIENKVKIYSLDPSDCLQSSLAIQVIPARATSLALLPLDQSQLILAVGTQSGIFMRSQLDLVSGKLTDARRKFLGPKAVKLSIVQIAGIRYNHQLQPSSFESGSPNSAMALLALSSRPWILYPHQNTTKMLPLSCPPFDFAASLHSLQCPDSIVCTTRERLRILAIERLGEPFNQTEIPLRYTPRQSVIHPISKHLLIVESDHNALPVISRKKLEQGESITLNQKENINLETTEKEGKEEIQLTPASISLPPTLSPGADAFGRARTHIPESLYGVPQPGPGKWASCIRLLDVKEGRTLDLLELEDNEAALSITTCNFRDHSGEFFVCVGTAQNLVLHPKRSFTAAFIHVYALIEQGRRLQLLHKKPVEDIPGALAQFNSRLLAGIGRTLKIFDLGKRKPQLLRKCELADFPTHIVSISTIGERIIVGDLQESLHFVKYSRPDALSILADDTSPRWITCASALDYSTIAGGDKFGNVFVLRLPEKVAQLENDPTGKAMPYSQSHLNGAPHKLDAICNFYTGETITKVLKTRLIPGGSEFLIYSTIHGTLGALLPLTSREDVDFFSHLEMHMRLENPPLCGRDHLAYRSSYFAVKNIIDGDLCEQFAAMSREKQEIVAIQLDRSINDIQRKIEDARDQI